MTFKSTVLALLCLAGTLCLQAQNSGELTREMLDGKGLDVVDSTDQQRFDAHYFEALKQMNISNKDAAYHELEKCLEINSNAASVWFNMGILRYLNNEVNGSLPYIKNAYALSPDFITYGQAYFNLLLKTGNYAEAAAIGEDLINRFPADDRTYYELIKLYAYQKNPKKVFDIYSRLEAVNGFDQYLVSEKIPYYVSLYPLKKGTKLAVKEIERLISTNPKNLEYHSLLADIYFATNDSAKGLAVCERLVRDYPDNGFAYLSLYNYYDNSNDSVKALEMLQKAMNDRSIPYSYFSQPVLSYLSGYVQHKQYDEAEKFMTLVRKHFGDEAEVCNLSARLCYDRHQIAEAVEYARTVIDFQPDKETSWSFLASIYAAENNDTALYKLSCEAEKLFPLSEEWPYYKMVYFIRQEMYDSLLVCIDHAVETLPVTATSNNLKAEMLNTKSSVLWEQKKTKAALEACEQALTYNPQHAMVLNNYAYFLALCDTNLNKALKMIELSLKIDGKQANSLDTYAYVLFKMGDYRSARFFMERAMNMTEDKVLYFEHYGDILYHLDLKAEALDYWQKAAEGSEQTSEVLQQKIKEQKYIPEPSIIIE